MKSNLDQSKEGITFRLRTKFLIVIILAECLIMSSIILVVERQLRHSILDEFRKRGIAISKHLSSVNANLVTTYNYVSIEQNVARAVNDNGLTYALIQLFDGEVAAYSGEKDIKEDILSNPNNSKAFSRDEVLVQYMDLGGSGKKICDLTAPIIIQGKKWATVRVGLSLENIHATIQNTRKVLFLLGLITLILGCFGSVLFAGRITRPVATLVDSVEAISEGNYDQEIRINTRDEIGYLAHRFGAMQETLKENIQLLTDSNLELSNTNQRLQSLFEASQAMSSLQNQDRLYDLILDAALTAADAFGASLVLIEPEHPMRIVASVIKESQSDVQGPNYKTLLEKQPFFQQPHSIYSNLGDCAINLEYLEDTPFVKTCMGTHPDLEILSIPLRQSERLAGFINLIRKKNSAMNNSEMQALAVLSIHTTASLKNYDLFIQLEEAYLSSIKSLAKTLEFKDEYTHGHAERVAKICNKIAKRMNMDKKSLKILYNAALLHDIGKIGLVESILNKKSDLDYNEWEMVKKHPGYGDEILKPIFSLQNERKIVRHHHEREDGKGYPDGLDGKNLSLSEKIIIVADAFDAMNSKRSYRDSLSPDIIKKELQNNKEKQFDVNVTDMLLEIYEDELYDNEIDYANHKVILFSQTSASNLKPN